MKRVRVRRMTRKLFEDLFAGEARWKTQRDGLLFVISVRDFYGEDEESFVLTEEDIFDLRTDMKKMRLMGSKDVPGGRYR